MTKCDFNKKAKKYCQFAYANNYVYPFFHISARQV